MTCKMYVHWLLVLLDININQSPCLMGGGSSSQLDSYTKSSDPTIQLRMLYIFQRPFIHVHNHDLCSICIPLLCIHVYSYILWKVPSPRPKSCWAYHMFPSMLSCPIWLKEKMTTWLYMLTVHTDLCPLKVLLHVQDMECTRDLVNLL